MTAVEIPEPVRRRLVESNFWHVATLNPDGSPQVTPMWVDLRDGLVLVNTFKGRKKHRNLTRDPRVAMSLIDPDSLYSNMAVQGRVVEWYDGERADRDIDDLCEKYTGQRPYPWGQPGEERVTFLIEPAHVWYRPPR